MEWPFEFHDWEGDRIVSTIEGIATIGSGDYGDPDDGHIEEINIFGIKDGTSELFALTPGTPRYEAILQHLLDFDSSEIDECWAAHAAENAPLWRADSQIDQWKHH